MRRIPANLRRETIWTWPADQDAHAAGMAAQVAVPHGDRSKYAGLERVEVEEHQSLHARIGAPATEARAVNQHADKAQPRTRECDNLAERDWSDAGQRDDAVRMTNKRLIEHS